jgi:acyl phosphate:glycerol-3-phosphate acyltransferase
MILPWKGIAWVLASYLSGAVPYGLLISRARGLDIRKIGSGNIGATNAARAMGKRLGLLVLLLDLLKGLAPVLAARLLLPAEHRELWVAGCMVSAVLGHVFSIFLGLRGGKGVATGLGVILAVSPVAALVGVILFVALYAVFRLSSLGSLVGTLVAPGVMLLRGLPRVECLAALTIALLILLKHHENIRRLLRGEERRV